MILYVARRLVQAALTVVGVLVVLFFVFFALTRPDDMAKRALGPKATPQAIVRWQSQHGYDRPLLPSLSEPKKSLLWDHMTRMLRFDWGTSDLDDTRISERLSRRLGPTLCLTLPLFGLGLLLQLLLGATAALLRNSYLDKTLLAWSVLASSLSILVLIVGVQYVFGIVLRWFPIQGFSSEGLSVVRFLAMPLLVGLLSAVGPGVRFYRSIVLAEAHREYVRTARAMGASESRILFRQLLPNVMLPFVTHVATDLPYVFVGSVLLEGFFGIPGVGSMTIDAIQANDFSVLRVMVCLGSWVFVLGQVVSDVALAVFDPRVRLT